MDTRNATTIKLALDAVDLEILCWVLNEAMSKNTVDRRQHYSACPQPAGRRRHAGGAAMNRSRITDDMFARIPAAA